MHSAGPVSENLHIAKTPVHKLLKRNFKIQAAGYLVTGRGCAWLIPPHKKCKLLRKIYPGYIRIFEIFRIEGPDITDLVG